MIETTPMSGIPAVHFFWPSTEISKAIMRTSWSGGGQRWPRAPGADSGNLRPSPVSRSRGPRDSVGYTRGLDRMPAGNSKLLLDEFDDRLGRLDLLEHAPASDRAKER